ncbi:MAG: RluA family pseudouridine synthase [Tannerella sp.]|jgi:23S rRNA pseudouridine1911/1915/1917 synthase|nr:RluA family pseudouridine synthase [Tannerella sp.]
MDDIDEDDIALEEVEDVEGAEGSLYEHFRIVADRNQSPLRIDKFLSDRLTNTSRSRIKSASEADCILVNGISVKTNYRIKPLDVITIMMSRPRHEFDVIPEDIPLNIAYEDSDLMVVNKPAGLVVHPGHGNYTGTLLNGLAYYLKDDPCYDATDPRLGLVHRIDKDTSGLLVIAKRPETKTLLSRQFFDKTTQRRYLAMVWGIPKEDEGRIEGNIGRDLRDRTKMAVFTDGEQGKEAVTHYRVIEKFGYVSLLEFRLETGRTHQIRVHSKHIGHPVFNDERYGGDQVLKGLPTAKYNQFIHNCFEACPRQALHAKTLGFVNPVSGEEMFFDSEIPPDMQALIERWQKYYNTQ